MSMRYRHREEHHQVYTNILSRIVDITLYFFLTRHIRLYCPDGIHPDSTPLPQAATLSIVSRRPSWHQLAQFNTFKEEIDMPIV